MFNQNGNIMASPWEFRNRGQSGLPVSDLFPHIGACADDLAVIRSMTSVANEHAQGNFYIHTGFSLAGFPSAGAWMTYGLGSESQNLPGYVVLASGGAPLGGVNIYGNGFLPAVHQASLIDPTQKEPLANITPREADGLQRKRLGFIGRLDQRHLTRLQGDEQVESAIQNYELAYRMQSAVPDLVDLRGESEVTKNFTAWIRRCGRRRNTPGNVCSRAVSSSAACASSSSPACRARPILARSATRGINTAC